jgi:uncharacterized damage-inducible protein DinB
MTQMIDRFRHWLEYEEDAHRKVVESLESVPAERRSSPEYMRAVSIFGHVAAARRIWLFRLGGIADGPKSIFPENQSPAEVAADLEAICKEWAAYLSRLNEEELSRSLEYRALDGGRFRNRIEEVLTQLYGHSLYHRGQIAMLVKQAGGKPAMTDFVYWCREKV